MARLSGQIDALDGGDATRIPMPHGLANQVADSGIGGLRGALRITGVAVVERFHQRPERRR